jgi:hypothetical protein
MLEPTGPLPPSIYWRRRALAGAVCVLAVMLLAWIIGGLVGPADDQPVRGTASSRDLKRPPSSPPPSARPAAPSSTSSTTASPAPTSQPTSSPTLSLTSPPPSPPLRSCPDKVIKVAAEPGARSYRVGEHPLLRLTIRNTGEVPCTRDMSRKLRELVITTANGRKRLWSSNDCYAPPGTDQRTLLPAKPLSFSLNWAGRTSSPGCPVTRTTVEPGRYRLTASLAKLQSPPTTLLLTR